MWKLREWLYSELKVHDCQSPRLMAIWPYLDHLWVHEACDGQRIKKKKWGKRKSEKKGKRKDRRKE